ncbi:MAG: hypothetical protein R2708_04470 [Vicinamibacterales bacterium]
MPVQFSPWGQPQVDAEVERLARAGYVDAVLPEAPYGATGERWHLSKLTGQGRRLLDEMMHALPCPDCGRALALDRDSMKVGPVGERPRTVYELSCREHGNFHYAEGAASGGR